MVLDLMTKENIYLDFKKRNLIVFSECFNLDPIERGLKPLLHLLPLLHTVGFNLDPIERGLKLFLGHQRALKSVLTLTRLKGD